MGAEVGRGVVVICTKRVTSRVITIDGLVVKAGTVAVGELNACPHAASPNNIKTLSNVTFCGYILVSPQTKRLFSI